MSTQYNYQYGTEAENFYQTIPNPQVSPKHRPLTHPKKKLDIIFGMQLSLCGITIFLCSLVYVHGYAQFITKQAQLKNIKTDIRTIKSSISLTESQISEKLNLDVIRDRASQELGMSEPLPHQIVYIQLPQTSYTIYDQ